MATVGPKNRNYEKLKKAGSPLVAPVAQKPMAPRTTVSANGKNIKTDSPAYDEAVAAGHVISDKIQGTVRPANQRNIQQTTTQSRMQAQQNGTKLDARYARTTPEAANESSVSVVSDFDNADGTRTVKYSDGQSRIMTVTKNGDGSESYREVSGGSTSQPDNSDPYGLTSKVKGIQSESAKRIKEITGTLDRLAREQDSATTSLIEGIKSTYRARVEGMAEANSRRLAIKDQIGIREGRARYAPGVQAGILSDEEVQGHERIAELEGQMFTLIAQAEQARTTNKLTMFNTRMDKLEKVEDRMKTEIQNLYTNALAQEKNLREARKAEIDMQKTELDMVLDKSERAAPGIITAMSELKTTEEKTKFLEEYSRRSGIPTDVLLGDIETANRKAQKADLEIENIRNQISNRNANTGIAAQRERRLAAAEEKGDGDTDSIVRQIIDGDMPLSAAENLDDKTYGVVNNELVSLGLYNSRPPQWFVQAKEAETSSTLTDEGLQELWNEYRKAIGVE